MSSAVLGLALIALALPVAAIAQGQQDVEIVRQRIVDHALSADPDADTISGWAQALAADGSWPDIDYEGTRRSGWEPADHANRIRSMAIAWGKPESELRGQPELLEAILSALDYWIEQDPQCPNWWYNQIGVPRALYAPLLLLEDHLTDELRAGGLRVLSRAKLGMTGQNLVWVAQITAGRGCLERDPEVVAAAFDAIESEIRISGGEGIQADGSFYQHGAQLYSGGYGRGFAQDCPLFARLAHDTAFEFSDEAIEVLSIYLLDGEQWMIRGPRFDYSACGREITRVGAGSSRGFAGACRDMLAIDPPRRAEFEAFLSRLESDPASPEPPLVGNRCFWRSDLMSHHRPSYYASVRVTSDRLLQTEIVNSENTRGRHLADGVNYLYLDCTQYPAIFPVWDWQALPGTTCERTGDPSVSNGVVGERSFAGGVSDGMYGLQAMDFARGPLSARKAWFFFDDEYVCLGAGITCDSPNPVITSLNQCLLDGDVRAGTAGAVPMGETVLGGETWVHHDDVGYVLAAPTDLTLATGTRTGSWSRIGTGSPEELTRDVFDLRIEHGPGPDGAEYAYIVLPAVTAEEAQRYAQDPPVEILANTPALQACRHPGVGVTGLAFYKAGAAELEGLPRIEVDRPCLLLWRETDAGVTLSASDPSHGTGTLTVTVGDDSVLTVDLPEGLEAGSGVTQEVATR